MRDQVYGVTANAFMSVSLRPRWWSSPPLSRGAIAHLIARVVRTYWGGDHSLFLDQVEHARSGESEPLLFFGGKYLRLTT